MKPLSRAKEELVIFAAMALLSSALVWHALIRARGPTLGTSLILGLFGGVIFAACFERYRLSRSRPWRVLVIGILCFPPVVALPLRALGYSVMGYILGFTLNLGYSVALSAFLRLSMVNDALGTDTTSSSH